MLWFALAFGGCILIVPISIWVLCYISDKNRVADCPIKYEKMKEIVESGVKEDNEHFYTVNLGSIKFNISKTGRFSSSIVNENKIINFGLLDKHRYELISLIRSSERTALESLIEDVLIQNHTKTAEEAARKL